MPHRRWAGVLLLAFWLTSCGRLGDEIVSEQQLSNGDTLRVTRSPGGPVGPQYSFGLYYDAAGTDEAQVIAGWERPPGDAEIDVYEQPHRLVILTPPREIMHVLDTAGRWQRWKMHDIVIESSEKDSTLFIPPQHHPAATVAAFDASTSVATVHVEIAGWPIQKLDLRLADDGDAVDVISVSNPGDPRREYLELFSLPPDTEVLTIAKDLSGDSLTDVLISHTAARNGKAGNIWSIYVATGQGFERIADTLSLRTDSVSGWTPSHPDAESPLFTPGITTYHPKSATSGTFVTYSLVDGALTTVVTKRQDETSANSEYENIFGSDLVIPVARTRFSD